MNLTPLFSQRKIAFTQVLTTLNHRKRYFSSNKTLNSKLFTILSKLSFYLFRHPIILIADNGIFQKDSMM